MIPYEEIRFPIAIQIANGDRKWWYRICAKIPDLCK
jgi:hypothetical protein